MIKKIPINENIYVVFSHDDYGYSEVIDDFHNASFINILSFNISANRSNDLLKIIKRLDSKIKVKIITNIPKRYEKYFGDGSRIKATQIINDYQNALHLVDFNENFVPFFNFSNHSKIIMTNNIAYIGSQNFSSESSANYECGIVIKDSKLIEQINREIFEVIEKDSSPNIEEEIIYVFETMKDKINLIKEKLKYVNENIHYGLTDVIDIPGGFFEFIDSNSERKGLINLDELHNLIYEIESFINQYSNDDRFYNWFGHIQTDGMLKIKELIDAENLNEWLHFDQQEFIEDYMEKHSLEADTEHLDKCNDDAAILAVEKSDKLFEKAQEEVELLLSLLKELLKETENLIKEMSADIIECQKKISQIDNTNNIKS